MNHRTTQLTLNVFILLFAAGTLLPFAFALNNSFRSNTEMYHSFFGLPAAFKKAAAFAVPAVTDAPGSITVVDDGDGARGVGDGRDGEGRGLLEGGGKTEEGVVHLRIGTERVVESESEREQRSRGEE